VQVHDVNRLQPRECPGKQRWDNCKIFRDVVRDRKVVNARGLSKAVSDMDDFEQFCRIAVEVDHVGRFLRRLRSGVIANATSA